MSLSVRMTFKGFKWNQHQRDRVNNSLYEIPYISHSKSNTTQPKSVKPLNIYKRIYSNPSRCRYNPQKHTHTHTLQICAERGRQLFHESLQLFLTSALVYLFLKHAGPRSYHNYPKTKRKEACKRHNSDNNNNNILTAISWSA